MLELTLVVHEYCYTIQSPTKGTGSFTFKLPLPDALALFLLCMDLRMLPSKDSSN